MQQQQHKMGANIIHSAEKLVQFLCGINNNNLIDGCIPFFFKGNDISPIRNADARL